MPAIGRSRTGALLSLLLGLALPWNVQRACAASEWALKPLQQPPLPPSLDASGSQTNPIDAFVQERLQSSGLSISPPAAPRAIIRRLFLGLTGLLPEPEDVRRFEASAGSWAYTKVVDELLSSPRYGERWARYWMDAVHFAETHGHDQDRIRTNAWRYRDYLIHTFNDDKPYARFVEEQVAGDVLFPDTPEAIVALGFLSAGPWDESSLRDIREDTLDRQIARYVDRDDMLTTVMQTFVSATVQCARCHDHKSDPITQEDHYALQAVFAGVDRANRPYDSDSRVAERRKELRRQLKLVSEKNEDFLLAGGSDENFRGWEAQRNKVASAWRVLSADTFTSASGAQLARQPDGSILASGQHGPTDCYTLTFGESLTDIRALRLEVLPDPSLPHEGPGREPNGNLHLSEFSVGFFEPSASEARPVRFTQALSDYDQPGWTAAHAIDSNPKTAWGIYPKVGAAHTAIFIASAPFSTSSGTRCVVQLRQLHGGHCIGRFRISATSVSDVDALAPIPTDIDRLLAIPAAQRTKAQQLDLLAFHETRHIDQQLAGLPEESYVFAAASDFPPDGAHKPAGAPRVVHVLHRGEITRPGKVASPGTLSCVEGLPSRFESLHPENEGGRRAALAHWLTDSRNALTWRSIVNRVWARHFGKGIVETLNDFGAMGEAPSHPKLLDWLAVWFRDEAKGSFKDLDRLIVTSETYRQKAGISHPDLDPGNRLLACMSRMRMDAEQVRDTLLQISGELDLRMGGPSDRHFDLQPGIHVTPKVDYTLFDPASVEGRRRSIYRFLFRTLPDPMMDALDCPAGDQLSPTRSTASTVQQALALWNGAFATHRAARIGDRIDKECTRIEDRVARLVELIFQRTPTESERRSFAEYARENGSANLARVLINSNEFMFID